ncbi:Hypothetical protein SRAE_2000442100 [Strongyloides ratti]|uniref:Uncharacterized protein n=1 Tax=Strongyloides ratti TaxID=34506 RepID=A0A090MZZ1_STRRB|nr:Hypothetical protein SRAE_2000442100 [Strongyloides ratti]CEF69775.1 Hypothetical protein SRAE_2000442100 [Strongyloides ratti]
MLLYLFQLTLHIFITFIILVINCGGGKKEEQDSGEIKKQIVLARAGELNDQETFNRTMDNELIRLKQEIKSHKDTGNNYTYDNAGCTPFPTPVTTPFPEELKVIEREKSLLRDVNMENPQIFRV